ncbi:MAG: type II toxin-antitoxin system VapC family toxin [Blastochloris sp.]|nr:type II toxin-antitoxin system VapC family toxin [Blastochloris sp.]
MELLQNFLTQSVVSLIGVDFEVCEVYARIGQQLRLAGTPIPTNDHWIASIAVRNNGTLLTRDRHFDNVAGLAVAHWEE